MNLVCVLRPLLAAMIISLPNISTALESQWPPKPECGYLLTSLAYMWPRLVFPRVGEAVFLNEVNNGRSPMAALQKYFDKVKSVYRGSPTRSKIYSAEDVLAVANAIQLTLQRFEAAHGVSLAPLTLFGSFANGYAGVESDIDVMGDLKNLPENLQDQLLIDITTAIETKFQERRLPVLKLRRIEPVPLTDRADYAIDGRPFLLEIGTSKKRLILVPRRAIVEGGRGALISRVEEMDEQVVFIPVE